MEANGQMKFAAQAWVDKMKETGKQYEKITPSKIKNIEPGSILYIHAHGLSPLAKDYKPAIFRTSGASMDASELAAYLIDKELKKEHKVLKIAACYSNVLAVELNKELLQHGYNNLTVYGYKEELILLRGKNGGKLAGIKHATDEEHSIFEKYGDEWEVSDKLITEELKDKHKASKHRDSKKPAAETIAKFKD